MNKSIETFLLCRPDHFKVDYAINPWMVNQNVDQNIAMSQWEELKSTITSLGGKVKTIQHVDGLPDMVFTANSGIVRGNTFLSSKMHHPERQGETIHFKKWFKKNGYQIVDLIPGISFEGRGDALFQGDCMIGGYGYRSDLQALQIVSKTFGVDLIDLKLKDPRFYHLDTCLCKVSKNKFIYFPEAFVDGEIEKLKRLKIELIPVTEADARLFACNSMLVNDVLLIPDRRIEIVKMLRNKHGIKTCHVNVGEFLKSGGSIQCLCLKLYI